MTAMQNLLFGVVSFVAARFPPVPVDADGDGVLVAPLAATAIPWGRYDRPAGSFLSSKRQASPSFMLAFAVAIHCSACRQAVDAVICSEFGLSSAHNQIWTAIDEKKKGAQHQQETTYADRRRNPPGWKEGAFRELHSVRLG